MKVKALGKFEHVFDTTVSRTRKRGEIFDVSEERAKVLLMNSLVVIVEEPKEHKQEKMAQIDKVIKEQTEPKKKGGRPKKK